MIERPEGLECNFQWPTAHCPWKIYEALRLLNQQWTIGNRQER